MDTTPVAEPLYMNAQVVLKNRSATIWRCYLAKKRIEDMPPLVKLFLRLHAKDLIMRQQFEEYQTENPCARPEQKGYILGCVYRDIINENVETMNDIAKIIGELYPEELKNEGALSS